MKIKSIKTAMFALCITVIFACKKNSLNAVESASNSTSETESNVVNTIEDLTINTGMTLAQMNAVIAAASAGQIVRVDPGTYLITGKVVMKPGVILKKKVGFPDPIFDARDAAAELYTANYGQDLSNCTIDGIIFWNYRFVITSAQSFTFKYCTFDYGERKAGTTKSYLNDAYIQLQSTNLSVITDCTFSRRAGNTGRGIYIKAGTNNSKILNCTFGNGGTTGYFVTAVNDNIQTNSLIQGNIINRTPGLPNADTDHGIYAHSFNGLIIQGNTISGWPADASGGAVKARNGQNLTIENNTFNTSGILLYNQSNAPGYLFLNNVKILNNTINITTSVNDIYHGIGYYRDHANGTEKSVRVAGNTMPNGTISFAGTINIPDFNLDGGGVFNNDYGIYRVHATINQSGNF
jgi:hypothetical protein